LGENICSIRFHKLGKRKERLEWTGLQTDAFLHNRRKNLHSQLKQPRENEMAKLQAKQGIMFRQITEGL
jgi:hypothetical protein